MLIEDKLDILHQITTRIGCEVYETRCQNKSFYHAYVQFLLRSELSKGLKDYNLFFYGIFEYVYIPKS